MMGMLDNSDLQNLLDEVIRERDELIDRLESCRMALDDMTEHAEEFKAEVRRMKEERDDAIEHADSEKQFADGLKAERDEARRCAEEMRDLYAVEIEVSWKAIPLPWEAEK